EWSVVDIRFDDRNKLLGFTLRNEASEESTTYGEEGGEYFLFTIDVPSTSYLIQTKGMFHGGTREGKYNWLVSVDGGEPVLYSGASNTYGFSIPLGSAGEHTIKIEENITSGEQNTFQWFRAFGYGPNGSDTGLAKLVSPLPEKGMNVSENNAGDYYAFQMFMSCNGASFTMGDAFTIPQSIETAGEGFCREMFFGCTSPVFTMGKNFNLPQQITNITGNDFCSGMFRDCTGNAFTMNSIFNLPQKITGTVGNSFCILMFVQCTGNAFTMNSIFNIPEGITVVGNQFCTGMFQMCAGSAFTMNSKFNLPQNITTVGTQFCSYMFHSSVFQVNSVFQFPKLSDTELNKADTILDHVFMDVTAVQTRMAVSIINGNGAPNSDRDTFNSTGFGGGSDWSTLDSNWKQ
ncbi:MAG: hypothetical protein LBU07_03930, partial [Coriobacteriales bacterium]|nr:hypothetical protein [Coriobacteriales bacterium]